MNCGAGLYTLAFSETVGFSVVYTWTTDLLFSLFKSEGKAKSVI